MERKPAAGCGVDDGARDKIKELDTCDRANPCNCDEFEGLAQVFRALGHPARLSILDALSANPDACCGNIVDRLPLAQSTVSQHLQVLKDAGLLTCCTRGRRCHYDLDRGALQDAAEAAEAFLRKVANADPAAPALNDKTCPDTAAPTEPRNGTDGELI
ncbi:ArsR/SmtB family transcription factor [Roseibium sp.]|uniref:ArsR/SmtB family transcription factor n=1 Tax=Roseibium sp. TaxID=1936156 RepID=UPI003A970331